MSVEVWTAIGVIVTAYFGYLGIRFTQAQIAKVKKEEIKETGDKNAVDGYRSLVDDLRTEVGRLRTKIEDQETHQNNQDDKVRESVTKIHALEMKVARMERNHAEDMGAAVRYITVLLELIRLHAPDGAIPSLPARLSNYFEKENET